MEEREDLVPFDEVWEASLAAAKFSEIQDDDEDKDEGEVGDDEMDNGDDDDDEDEDEVRLNCLILTWVFQKLQN